MDASPSKRTSLGEVAFVAPMLNVEHVTARDDFFFQDEEKTSLGWATFICEATSRFDNHMRTTSPKLATEGG